MNQKKISLFLSAADMLAALGILFLAGIYAPAIAAESRFLYQDIPGIDALYWTGLAGVWSESALFLLALFEYFRVCRRIGKNQSFCQENVKCLYHIAMFMAFGAFLWLCGIFVPSFLFSVSIGPVWIFLLLLAMANAALSILAWGLGKLLNRAVEIKQENDLTV